jgi:Protein of unknown function (DUF1579)
MGWKGPMGSSNGLLNPAAEKSSSASCKAVFSATLIGKTSGSIPPATAGVSCCSVCRWLSSTIAESRGKSPVGDFEGLLVMTWDPKEKAYKAYVFGNGFPGAIVQTGQFEGDSLVFRTEFSAGGPTLKLRNVTRLVSPGRIVSEEYFSAKDAPEVLFVTVDAKKR